MIPATASSDCILIAGYYGYGNTGDEAILFAIMRELRVIAPHARLFVLSGKPAETAERFGVDAFDANDAGSRMNAIARSRLVIIGGGGLFHDYWGLSATPLFAATSGMKLFMNIALAASLHRVPMMLWALGVGPLLTEEGRITARAICRLAAAITVRDEHSRRELEAVGVPCDRIRVTADAVFASPPAPAMTPAVGEILSGARIGNAPLIAVCLRHWDVSVEPSVWEGLVAEALDQAAARTAASFVFIPFQSRKEMPLDDVAAADRVRALMSPDARATIVQASLTVAETWALIDSCDCVLGMRFHAGVAAATRAVPFVTLGYDPKVSHLGDELGLPERNIDVASVDSGRLAGLLEASLAHGPALRQTIRDAAIRLGIQGRQTAMAARAILDGGANPLSVKGEEPFETRLVRFIAEIPEGAPARAIVYEPLISVVLPVWNHSRYVGDAIRSVLMQTWRNLELIVIDDGSDEDISPELDAAIAGDARAVVVRRSHQGLPRSLSAGFYRARGEYFSWTSADNIMKPEALAFMACFLLHHPETAMVYANMDLIDETGKALTGSDYRVSSQRRGATNEVWLPHPVETLGLVEDNFIGPCFLYRGETGRLLGDYDASRVGVEDYEYWLRMSLSVRIAHLDSEECLYSYRVHDDTLTVRQAEVIAKDVTDLIQFHRARVKVYWQAFHIAIVVNPETAGLGRTATNIAAALREMRHNVTEFDFPNSSGALNAWAEENPDVKTIAMYFGNCGEAISGVFCFNWLSSASAQQSTARCRMIRSSKRIGESRWPLLPASGTAYRDLVLCMKARGTAFPLWGLPEEPRDEVFVYLGPIDESLIDWAAVENLASAKPAATILFISTDAARTYDPRIRVSSAMYVGFRAPLDRYIYLSRATILIAPFADAPGVEEIIYDVLMSYLAAGKPIVATPPIGLIGFADIPNARIACANGFGEAAQCAMHITPNTDLATAYMESKSPRAFADALLLAANHEICQRASGRSDKS